MTRRLTLVAARALLGPLSGLVLALDRAVDLIRCTDPTCRTCRPETR